MMTPRAPRRRWTGRPAKAGPSRSARRSNATARSQTDADRAATEVGSATVTPRIEPPWVVLPRLRGAIMAWRTTATFHAPIEVLLLTCDVCACDIGHADERRPHAPRQPCRHPTPRD